MIPFYAFNIRMCLILYTTNATEALNARLRRAVRHVADAGAACLLCRTTYAAIRNKASYLQTQFKRLARKIARLGLTCITAPASTVKETSI